MNNEKKQLVGSIIAAMCATIKAEEIIVLVKCDNESAMLTTSEDDNVNFNMLMSAAKRAAENIMEEEGECECLNCKAGLN